MSVKKKLALVLLLGLIAPLLAVTHAKAADVSVTVTGNPATAKQGQNHQLYDKRECNGQPKP